MLEFPLTGELRQLYAVPGPIRSYPCQRVPAPQVTVLFVFQVEMRFSSLPVCRKLCLLFAKRLHSHLYEILIRSCAATCTSRSFHACDTHAAARLGLQALSFCQRAPL